MTDIPQEEIVTCVSCDYRYPRSWGACNICGAPAPITGTVRTQEALLPEKAEAAHVEHAHASIPAGDAVATTVETTASGVADAGVIRLARRASVLVSSAAAVIAVVGLVAHGTRTFVSAPASDTLVREIASASAPPDLGVRAGARIAAVPPAGRVPQPRSARPQPERVQAAQPAKAEDEDTLDPARLWQRVRQGSTTAEVALAKLYLEGDGLEQNCEQAHLLLVAASKRGSKAAADVLDSSYASRCN